MTNNGLPQRDQRLGLSVTDRTETAGANVSSSKKKHGYRIEERQDGMAYIIPPAGWFWSGMIFFVSGAAGLPIMITIGSVNSNAPPNEPVWLLVLVSWVILGVIPFVNGLTIARTRGEIIVARNRLEVSQIGPLHTKVGVWKANEITWVDTWPNSSWWYLKPELELRVFTKDAGYFHAFFPSVSDLQGLADAVRVALKIPNNPQMQERCERSREKANEPQSDSST